MAEQNLVSLKEMQARFANLKNYELEIACEMTIPITISVYRGENEDGSIPPLYCTIQFTEGEVGYSIKLLDSDNQEVNTLEEVSQAFNIPMNAKQWEVTIEEEDEE